MRREVLSSMMQLLNVIGTAGSDSQNRRGPVIIEIELQGELGKGRTVLATYYGGDKAPDLETRKAVLWDNHAIELFAKRLLHEGEPFVTKVGMDDQVCVLEWTIVKPVVVIQSGPRTAIMGVYGPFTSLHDPELLEVLRKRLLHDFDELKDRQYFPIGPGVSLTVCEVSPFAEDMV